jgi:hypothetical protein
VATLVGTSEPKVSTDWADLSLGPQPTHSVSSSQMIRVRSHLPSLSHLDRVRVLDTMIDKTVISRQSTHTPHFKEWEVRTCCCSSSATRGQHIVLKTTLHAHRPAGRGQAPSHSVQVRLHSRLSTSSFRRYSQHWRNEK